MESKWKGETPEERKRRYEFFNMIKKDAIELSKSLKEQDDTHQQEVNLETIQKLIS